ncbi:MAG: S24/S26 family peptidase [Saccharofermentans sp.]|nr:S24/S26 family peptidase [Saccharofermentans sp.]
MASFEDELERSGRIIYKNSGTSMLPLIKQGRDLLIIERPQGRLKKYDIPLYKMPDGRYVLHRIIKVRENDYVIRGDNRINEENGITDSQIIGVLTSLVRQGKEVDFNSFGYKFYVRFWCITYPVRVMIIKFKSLLRRLKK